jgi:phosphoglucomutase
MGNKPAPDFDLDLQFGEFHEELLFRSLSKTGNVTVEVKTDRLAAKTGNLAIEFKYKGKPSGILTTKADEWFFVVLEEDGSIRYRFNVPTARLKKIAHGRYKRGYTATGGQDNQSEMVLVPALALISRTPEEESI